MKLVTYQYRGEARIGTQLNGQIVDLNRACKAVLRHHHEADELAVADARVPSDMIGLLNGGETSLKVVRRAAAFVEERIAAEGAQLESQGIVCALDQVELLPPVLRPGKVIGVGWNYYDLVEEFGTDIPEYPVLFHKTAGSLLGHGQNIVIPPISDQINFECELAVIIGKRGKSIAESEALSYVAGYACANDVAATDLERRTPQMTTGVMLDTFGPLGPALVTRDEIPDPNALGIKSILNGEVTQDDNTEGMIFKVPFLISYISSLATLEPGDVIFTGSPSGLGLLRDPPVFLKPGDTISIEIENLGILTNPVVAETGD